MNPTTLNLRTFFQTNRNSTRTLEIFAGTQSFSKGVKRISPDAETITVDLLDKFKPTHTTDIMSWDYTQYPTGYFDTIWCSPPCTEYSKAKTRGVRDLKTADMLVRKSFEIIDYFKPRVWIVENVGTGLLVKRMETIRAGLSSSFVDYCVYGKPYRKRTILWSNIPLHLGLCAGEKTCTQMDGAKHKGSCGNGTARYNAAGVNSVWEKDEIPEPLIDTILAQISV